MPKEKKTIDVFYQFLKQRLEPNMDKIREERAQKEFEMLKNDALKRLIERRIRELDPGYYVPSVPEEISPGMFWEDVGIGIA